MAVELEEDDLESHIQVLEAQILERDGSIRSLDNQLNNTWVWARAIARKGGKRRWIFLFKTMFLLQIEVYQVGKRRLINAIGIS